MATRIKAIAGPILARNEKEAAHLIAAVRALARFGLPVYLVDGGSAAEFVEAIRGVPGVTIEPLAGDTNARLQSQVKQALKRAADHPGNGPLLYTEPDKLSFFENGLGDLLEFMSFLPPTLGVMYASRDDESFETYPDVMQTPERLLNTLVAETLGLPVCDLCFGPMVFAPDLVPYLDRIPGDCGWGWRIYLGVVAHRLERSFGWWVSELPCPPEQRDENDEASELYRLRQMEQNVRGLHAGLSVPLIPAFL